MVEGWYSLLSSGGGGVEVDEDEFSDAIGGYGSGFVFVCAASRMMKARRFS